MAFRRSYNLVTTLGHSQAVATQIRIKYLGTWVKRFLTMLLRALTLVCSHTGRQAPASHIQLWATARIKASFREFVRKSFRVSKLGSKTPPTRSSTRSNCRWSRSTMKKFKICWLKSQISPKMTSKCERILWGVSMFRTQMRCRYPHTRKFRLKSIQAPVTEPSARRIWMQPRQGRTQCQR